MAFGQIKSTGSAGITQGECGTHAEGGGGSITGSTPTIDADPWAGGLRDLPAAIFNTFIALVKAIAAAKLSASCPSECPTVTNKGSTYSIIVKPIGTVQGTCQTPGTYTTSAPLTMTSCVKGKGAEVEAEAKLDTVGDLIIAMIDMPELNICDDECSATYDITDISWVCTYRKGNWVRASKTCCELTATIKVTCGDLGTDKYDKKVHGEWEVHWDCLAHSTGSIGGGGGSKVGTIRVGY